MEIKYKKVIVHQSVGGEEEETEVLLPDFGDEQEQRDIGLWGRRHLRYIRENRKVLYTELLTSGRLNSYLADIDHQAGVMFARLVEQMAQRQGVTEQLKAENQMAWVGRMNNIQASAREIVNTEIIYA